MKALPLIFVALIGAVILMIQWSHRRKLEEQLQSIQPEEISLSTRSRTRATSPAGISSKRESLMADLKKYVASQEGELIDLLSQATAEDLHALIIRIQENPDTLESPDPFDSRDPSDRIQWALRTLLDEMDPLAVLKSENRAESFMALTRQSPEEALRWLDSSSLSDHEREGFMGLFRRLRMSKEPSKYLEHLKEAGESSIYDLVLLEPAGVADLMPFVNLPENERLRESLISSIIFSSLMEGEGLAKSRMEALGLGTEEIVTALESSEDFGSKETLEWAIELNAASPERTLGLIDVFMGRFAVQDLEGASEWMRKFEGSQFVRDEVTKRYAAILGSTEPEVALNWIEKIQDKQAGERMKRNTLIGWEAEDPEGFAKWKRR
jgi:hypothetical protein